MHISRVFTDRIAALLLFLVFSVCSRVANSAEPGKPTLLYSRYFNAVGEKRYLPDGSYKPFLDLLRQEWNVQTDSAALTPERLAGVQLVLIANPSDRAVGTNPAPHHINRREIQTLVEFVKNGGGVMVMGNQEDHNLEVSDMNGLLGEFGMMAVNEYTDAKQIVIPNDAPILGGLRWAYYTGNQLRLDPTHPARPRSIVQNDLLQKPIKGPRDAVGCLLAGAEIGKGRFVAVTESGWLTDVALSGEGIGGVSIKDHDNFKIFSRIAKWAIHAER